MSAMFFPFKKFLPCKQVHNYLMAWRLVLYWILSRKVVWILVMSIICSEYHHNINRWFRIYRSCLLYFLILGYQVLVYRLKQCYNFIYSHQSFWTFINSFKIYIGIPVDSRHCVSVTWEMDSLEVKFLLCNKYTI